MSQFNGIPLVAADQQAVDKVRQAVGRALRPVSGKSGIEVRDTPSGISISLQASLLGGKQGQLFESRKIFLAKITGVTTNSGVRTYTWREVAISYISATPQTEVQKPTELTTPDAEYPFFVDDGTAWSLWELPLMTGATLTAENSEGAGVPVGTIVLMFEFCAFDDTVLETEQVKHVFITPPAATTGALFAVKVTQTAGSAGSKTTQCSFTYTVKDLAGTTLGTGMSPLKRRPSVGKMTAGAADTIGLAYYDTDGTTLKLYDANEVNSVGAC